MQMLKDFNVQRVPVQRIDLSHAFVDHVFQLLKEIRAELLDIFCK